VKKKRYQKTNAPAEAPNWRGTESTLRIRRTPSIGLGTKRGFWQKKKRRADVPGINNNKTKPNLTIGCRTERDQRRTKARYECNHSVDARRTLSSSKCLTKGYHSRMRGEERKEK